MPEMKEWTLMFYFGSDNPLAPSIVPQLKSIKQAGFHQQVNVVAQFDPQPEGTPTHIFDVNLINKLKLPDKSQVGFSGLTVDDPFVSNLIEDKLWRDQTDRTGKQPIKERLKDSLLKSKHHIVYDPPEPPSGTKLVPVANEDGAETATAPAGGTRHHDDNGSEGKKREVELNPRESLQAFLKFCAKEYPARHYILFILGHGLVVANDIFLFDEHADQQSLSLKGLGQVLTEFKTDLHDQVPVAEFELVSFHSCSVSSLEVAYELQGTANYMLASQGPAFVGSWPYRQILIRLFKNTDGLKKLDEKEEKEKVRKEIKQTLLNITDYCFHNSKDFLLAGYPFDVALCDLTKVSDYFTASLAGLKDVLLAGLDDALLKNFILLAHLESQSDWQESYTDLNDFCFCLSRQCTTFKDGLGEGAETVLGVTLTKLDNIVEACGVITGLLSNDTEVGSNGIIVKSEFVGPEHQYSHGLSVYFPWSKPLDDTLILADYEKYKFNTATKWLDFLLKYFDKTQRQSQKAEINNARRAVHLPVLAQTPDEELSEDLASLVFNGGGQPSVENTLALPGEKVNPNDRTGEGCTCTSIKNYPRDTRDFRARQREAAQAGTSGDVLSQSQALLPSAF
jgi:hypothetical protein